MKWHWQTDEEYAEAQERAEKRYQEDNFAQKPPLAPPGWDEDLHPYIRSRVIALMDSDYSSLDVLKGEFVHNWAASHSALSYEELKIYFDWASSIAEAIEDIEKTQITKKSQE